MTHIVTISEDTTLGEAHAGMTIVVDAGNVILPHEDTHKNIEGDEWVIIHNSDNNVSVTGESGTTIKPLSNALLTTKGASVKIQYQGSNIYLMWGNI